MKKFLIISILLLVGFIGKTQIIPPVGVASNYTLTSGQITTFYDPSGPGGNPCGTGPVPQGNYQNCNCLTTITINAAAGEFLILSFNEFSMWNTTSGWDWMKIYDGPNTASPILYDNSAGGPDNPFGDCGIGTTILDFCSTGNALTFEFWATSVVNRAGWDATVSSVNSACNPLPIELVDFDGYDEDDVNKIYWVTASEINNDYFTLEKSEDGIHWTTLTTVKGAGNTSTPSLYEYTDEDPYISYTYYRLSQTDFDGRNEMFNVIAIQNESTIFYTYHKQGDNSIYMSSSYDFEFYNMMGQVVRHGFGDSINTDGLTQGIYILKINDFTQKFFIR